MELLDPLLSLQFVFAPLVLSGRPRHDSRLEAGDEREAAAAVAAVGAAAACPFLSRLWSSGFWLIARRRCQLELQKGEEEVR